MLFNFSATNYFTMLRLESPLSPSSVHSLLLWSHAEQFPKLRLVIIVCLGLSSISNLILMFFGQKVMCTLTDHFLLTTTL